ncbi:MAG: hypothetical protein IKQ90_02060 [Ruminococcus sp.]|nr:hypothetical protein [Ruminococcus sp.]
MDDIMEKFGKLLSDEESVKQLSELAHMLMSGSGEPSPAPDDANDISADSSGGGEFPDISMLMKLGSLAGAVSKNDKNAELLLALRPHLSEERQKKVDKAVKMLRLIAVWNIAKESGFLRDIL